MTIIVALIVGLGSIWVTFYTNRKNIKGNVVSKSRIEWIQEVRKQSVAFITAFYELNKYIKILQINNFFNEVDHNTRIERIEKEGKLSELKKELKEKGILLILYFGPDRIDDPGRIGDNEFINYVVSLILLKVDDLGKIYPAEDIIALEDVIYSLKDFLRIYLKAEWKRATGQIKDSDIQNYLGNDRIYNYIKESYSSGFESHQEYVENFYMNLRIKEFRNSNE